MRNTFLVKSNTKYGGKLVPDPFIKIKTEHTSGSTVWNVINLFLFYITVETHQNILRYWPLTFLMYKAILKNKKRSGTSLAALSSVWFFKKNISDAIFY